MTRLSGFAIPLVMLLAGSLAPPARGETSEARRREALELARHAAVLLDRATWDTRRIARQDLEQAVLVDPDNADIQVLLGRFYESAMFWHDARARYAKMVRRFPADPDGPFGLARVWRHDWLKFGESASLDSALARLEEATALRGAGVKAWTMLAVLRVERTDSAGALAAARTAVALAPGDADALTALATARWLQGDAAGAESTFVEALPRLPVRARRRFEDIGPVATEADTAVFNHLRGDARTEFARRFWVSRDPDPTTYENEAQLEYWSRVARAYALFWFPTRGEWDDRGELFVRFGPPDGFAYNTMELDLLGMRGSGPGKSLNWMRWTWSAVQLSAMLMDTHGIEYYELRSMGDATVGPLVNGAAADAAGMMAVAGGRAVFPRVAPGNARVPVAARASRFPADARTHVITALEVPGDPTLTLRTECVVLDSTQRVVARSMGGLSPSACEPDAYRVADFSCDLPPGTYAVGLSVSGTGRRGSARVPLVVAPPAASLQVSDLVVTCGAPTGSEREVRLASNPRGRVPPGQPLTAYFEVSHLQPDRSGQTHFEYTVAVRHLLPDRRHWTKRIFQPRSEPEIEARRTEDHVETMRRQFVSVPVQPLPPGPWRLDVIVRDLVSGAVATASAPFVQSDPTGDAATRAAISGSAP